jgi:hypothetical protein
MCIFTRFRYLCLHEKFKIAHACDKAALDRNGVLTCPDDPNPQIDDGKNHMCGARTHGIGVCASIHCAWHLSILPLGDYGDDKVSGQSTIFEDDTEIDDSPEAREDRVSRWYHLLDADQQLDHYQTEYPLPYDQRSSAGRALLEFPYGAAVTPLDSLQWKELNPKLLSPSMLQWCVFHRVLPASVVDGRKSKTISPIQPTAGPFKLTGSHKCSKKHGICKKCGANIGDRTLREKTMAYRQNAAFTALENEDSAKGDLKGSVWDPSVDLKWDDEKGVYVKVQTTNQDHDFPTQDEPYAASSSGLVFAPSTPQAVDTSDGFYCQDTSPLDEDVIFSGVELGFPDGMDWQDFTEAPTTTSLVTLIEAIAGEMYCPGLDFPHGPDGVPSSSLQQQQSDERLREPFHFDPSISFTEDPTATAEHIDFSFLGSGAVFGDFEGDMSMDAVFDAEDHDYTNQDETASEFALDFPSPPGSQYTAATDPYNANFISSQTPGPISSSATSTFPGASYEKQVEHFVAEQQIANATDYQPSAETLRVVVQMVRQAAVGGVSRPSYDDEANEIFEMMMQHAIAGLL